MKATTHSVPSILTPCRWAALIHPEGGIVTLWWEKLTLGLGRMKGDLLHRLTR